MKNPKFFLTTLFAAAAMSATAHAAGEEILINFNSVDGGKGDTSWGTWNELPANSNSGSASGLVNSEGETTNASLTYWSKNTWQNGNLSGQLKGYLDDGDSGVSISVSTSYLVADVSIYFSTDTSGRQYLPAQVNGDWYTYSNGATILGDDNWGTTATGTIEEGVNMLVVSGVSGDITVHTTQNGVWWGPRGCIAALKVVDAYAGTSISVSLDGAATDWTDSAIGSTPWVNSTADAGCYAAFTLSSDTSVNVTGSAIVTDGITVSGSGVLTLSGNEIELIGPGVVRASGASSIVVENSLTFTNGGHVSGNVSGNGVVSVTGGVLSADLSVLANFTGTVSVSGGGTLNLGNLTSAKTDVSSVTGDGTIVFNAQPTNHSSGIKLGAGFTGTIEVFGNANLPRDSELGGATKVILNNAYIWSGETITYSQLFEVVGSMTNEGGSGVNKQRGSANITYNGAFSLTENSSFAVEQGTATFNGGVLGAKGSALYVGRSGGAVTIGGNSTIESLYQTGGSVTITGEATFNQFVGTSRGQNAGSLNITEGAALTITGSSNSTAGNQGSFQLAHWGATQTVDVYGTFNLMNAGISSKDGNGDINIYGEMNFNAGLIVADSGSNSGVIRAHLKEGGRINIGSGGISESEVLTLNLLDGVTIGSLADEWVSSRALELGGTTTIDTGKLKFDASNRTVASGFGSNVTLSGEISGSGSLVKTGLGTLTLSGSNSYSGGTTIDGGVLTVRNATALGAGSVVLSGGTLDVSLLDSFSVSSLTASSGSIISLGMLSTDTASLTATGTLALDKGTIFDLSPALGGAEKITYILADGISGITDADIALMGRDNLLFGGLAATERVGATFVLDGSTLKLELAKPIFTDLTWIGGNGATWAHQDDTLWSSQIAQDTGSTPKFENGDTVIFNTADASVAVCGSVQPGGIIVNENVTLTGVDGDASLAIATGTAFTVATGKTATIDASLGTTGLLKKEGAGTLVLDATASSLFSSAQVAEGRVNLMQAEALTSAIATEIAAGATLGFSISDGASVALPSMFSGSGTLEKIGSGSLVLGGVNFEGILKIAEGALNVSGGTNVLGTLRISEGTAVISGGTISTVDGTIVENAELTISTGGSSSALRGKVTLNDGGKLRLTAGDATGWGGGATALNALVINEGGELIIETVATSANQTFNMSGGITLVGGKISGAQAYSKFDLYGGTTGITTLASGTTAEVAAAVALREHGTFNVADGNPEIDLLVSGMITNYGQVAAGSHYSAAFEKIGAGTLKLTGDNRYWTSGGAVSEGTLIAASGTALGTGAMRVDMGASLEFAAESGNFANTLSGSGEIVVNTTGTITLSGENTQEGTTTVKAGTLVAGSATALGTSSVSVASGAVLERGVDGVTLNSLTAASGSVLSFGSVFTGTGFAVTGTADLASDVKLNFSADFTSGTYVLLSAGSFGLDVSALGNDNLLFGGATSSRADATFSLTDDKLVMNLAKIVYSDLIWQGGENAVWENRGATLWASDAAGGTTTFENADSVTFGTADAAITVVGSVIAGNITVTENTSLSAGTGATAGLALTGSATIAEEKTFSLDKTIATSGALTKEGAGTFVVSAEADTFFSSLAVNAGTLSVTDYDGDAFDVSVASGAKLSIGVESGNVTYANAISGAGDFEKTGAGTLVLSQAGDTSGKILVSGGTLSLANKNALKAGSIIVNNGGTLSLDVNMDGTAYAYTLNGGSLIANVTTDYGSAQIASGTAITLTADSSVGGTANFGMISSGYAANALDLGGHTLTKTGTNTFFLAQTTISSGTIDVNEGVVQFIKPVTANGDVNFNVADDANLSFNGQNLTVVAGANVVIDGTFDSPGTIYVNAGSTLDLTGAKRKTDSSGNGVLIVKGGTVKIANMNWGAGSGWGANFNSDRIDLSNGGVLEVTQAQASARESAGITVSSEGTYRYSGTGTSYINAGGGAINVMTALTFDVVNADAVLNVAKKISVLGAVKIDGAGTVVLSGENDYTGGTTLEAGTLKLGSATALGSGTLTLAGGSLGKADGVADDLSVSNNVAVGATVNVSNLNFGEGVWVFTDALDTSFAGVALTAVAFSDTTIDVSGIDFDDDNPTMTLFTNYTGTAADFIVAGGAGAGTITVDGSKNVIFTAGANYLTLTWDPSAAGTANDKVWTGTLFNGADYSGQPTLRKFKFAETAADATEAGVIKGEVNAGRLNILGDYTFTGAADDAGTAAKITFGSSSDDAGVISGMADVVVATDKTLVFDKTVATSGGIDKRGEGSLVVAADAAETASTVYITEGTFGLSVADGGNVEYSGTFSGTGILEKLGSGTLVLAGDKAWFDGTVLVSEGTLKMGTSTALGDASSVSIIIGENGTLDLNGKVVDTNYGNYVLAGGALINTGTEIGDSKKQITGGFSLTADSSVGGTANFGMISSNRGSNKINLDEYTLTKTGTNTFTLCNTTLSATTESGKSATVLVSEGIVRFFQNPITIDGNVSFKTANDGYFEFNSVNLNIAAGSNAAIAGTFNNPGTITVNAGATLDLTAASRKEDNGGGTLVINGGTVVVANMKWGVGSNWGANFGNANIKISNDGVLEVNAEQDKDTAARAGFTVASGNGTYRYSGEGTSYLSENVTDQRIQINESATLAFDVANADASLEVSKVIVGAGALKADTTGTVTLTGANTYSGGTTLARGTLKIGGDSALGTGTATIESGAILETGVTESTTIANILAGTGTVNVKGDTTLGGANTFNGKYVVTDNATLSVGGKLGADTVVAEVADGSAVKYVFAANGTAGGVIELADKASVINAGADATITTFAGTIGGKGNIRQLSGTLDLISAKLGDFEGDFLLESGTLAGLKLDNSTAAVKATVSGGTMKSWTVNKATGTVSVNAADAVGLEGTIALTAGTLALETAREDAYFTGTGTVEVGSDFVFDFRSLKLEDTTDPNTKTASVQVFDTGIVLNGWDAVGFENIRIEGKEIDAHYEVEIGNSGDITITLTSQVITWTAGDAGDWDNATANWKLDDGAGAEISFANYDTVRFTSNAEVTLSGELKPAEIIVTDNVALTLKGTGSVLSGTTSLASGASLELLMTADAMPLFKNKISGTGMFVLDNAVDVSVSEKLNGANTFDGSVEFTKRGAGTLAADASQNAYSGDVSIEAGKILVKETNALGTGTVTLDGGNLEISAAKEKTVTLNNKLAGTTADALTISGDGKVVLTQASTYAGTTLVSGNAVAQNGEAFGESDVEITGSVTLDAEDATVADEFSGTGSLIAAQSATVTGNLSALTGTLEVQADATLKANSASSFAGAMKLADAATFEKIGSDTFALSGTIKSVEGSAIAVTGGKLAVGNDTADQSFAGTLTADATFEKTGTNTLTLSGELAGNGSISVTGGKLAVGGNNDRVFSGAFSVASGTTFEKIGANTLTLSGISGSGATTVSAGTLVLDVANDATLESVVSGSGTFKKSGAGALTLAAGTDVAKVDLAAGALKEVKLGTDGVTALTVSGTGTTLEALTMDGGSLDVSAASTTLAGTTAISGGTIYLGEAESASLIVSGATTLSQSDAPVFNFKSLDYPENTNPNTLGDTATVVYQVFSLNSGATLTGWNDSVLGKSNFTVGSGADLSDRAVLAFNDDGSVTVSNTIYDLAWIGGDGVWTTGDAGKAMWTHAANPDDTAYMNSDRVSFADKATVTLGANVAPTSLNIADGVDLTIAASDTYQITGAGTVAIGNGASLTLNSAHDYTGTTTLGDGATLRLNLAANDTAQFKSNLELKDSELGMFIVDTEALGVAAETTFNTVFAGTFGDGAWFFKKEGAGVLRIDSGKLSAFGEDDRINVAAGTLKLMSVDAVGTAKASVDAGAVLEVASASDATFATSISGKGTFKKSGGGTLTLATTNMNFGGDATVAEGTLKLENASALGDSRMSTAIEIARNANLEVAFGGSFGKELKGEGSVNYSSDERLILTADSYAFSGTFVIEKDNINLAAKQATSLGNGTIEFKGTGTTLAFELTPASGQKVAETFAGSFAGTGTISVETGTGISMTLSGASENFDGTILLKNASKLIAEKGEALGSADALVSLGNGAELYVGSEENSELVAKISGSGSLTKTGAGTVTLANGKNDFSGNVTVKDGVLYATSSAALGKSSQVLLDSTDATLKLAVTKTETFGKLVRGRGNFALTGGGTLNWTNPEKRFGGELSVSDQTTLNTSDFLTVDSGAVVLDNGAVWNAKGGFSVEGDASITLFANSASLYGLQSRASQTLASGTELRVGSFVATSNKSGTVTLENVAIVPTDGGTGALISFSLDSADDAKNARIVLTEDAGVSLDNVAVEVVFDESIDDVWDVPEIEFVYRDGQAADVSGDVASVTISMADGTEVKYVYDSRTGNLSLSPVSPDMNLAYAAMTAMPTEAFNQDVQSLHRRMEQRRFETQTNKDEWQFFAQAQSMQVENGDDRADSATFDFSTYGALVGGDVRLSDSTVFGMALAYDRGNADIHDNQGEIDMDSYRATVYAGTVLGDYCFAEAGAHFGFASYEIERRGEYGDNKGDTDGWSAGAFATVGTLIPTSIDDFYLTPYVGVAYLHTAIEEVEETGTRSMTTEEFEADSFRTRIGLGASYSFAIGETPTRFGLDLAYSHEFFDDEVDAEVGATGVAYSRTITEKALPEDAVSVGASFDFTLSENTALFLNYSADFGMNSDIAQRANVGFRFTY